VHHLLLAGADDPLATYYATVSGDGARPLDDQLYPTFAAFVDAHRADLEALVSSHTTQTNEARRTVITLPALGMVASESGLPLALLEAGASAGLNLLVDRYGFRIGSVQAGETASPVQLACTVEGELRPPVPAALAVAWRLGVDLTPLDVRDRGTRAWLRALVWPEHRDRMALLDAALEMARHHPPPLVAGDLTRDLPRLADGAPAAAALVVVSTWVLPYVSADDRGAFLNSLDSLARQRGAAVWLVACEAQAVLASLDLGLVQPSAEGYGPSMLALVRFAPDGGLSGRLLAECHAHGRWIRWLDVESAVGSGERA
jgi:hypothetical protein